MGLKDRIRNLEREANISLVVVEHEDGTTSRFREGISSRISSCTRWTAASATTSARIQRSYQHTLSSLH